MECFKIMPPEINLIAALSTNRVIGKDGGFPWHITADLKHFKELTVGNTVIMGRKTFESIGKPLPNRTNIVITRDRDFSAEGCRIVHSLEEAIDMAREFGKGDIFIIGGGQVYEQAMRFADKLILTLVHKEFDGDTFFPDYSSFTQVVSREQQEQEGLKFDFLVLKR